MKLEDLFADDKQLAEAVLGLKRAKAWAILVKHYEGRGLPPLDPLTGGRYVPAVRQFFDAIHGVGGATPDLPQRRPGAATMAQSKETPGLKWRQRRNGRLVPFALFGR
ncbi:MAG: hypothetical protein ACRECZ_03875 [Methylocella sp.]